VDEALRSGRIGIWLSLIGREVAQWQGLLQRWIGELGQQAEMMTAVKRKSAAPRAAER
jgi:hypothetical protein